MNGGKHDPAPRAHLQTLDGLRGIAAFCVVLFHLNGSAAHGYLAVDFFFILSGFVIGSAYEAPLRQGLGVLDYMRIRALRLFPMLLVGTVIGAIVFTAKAGSGEASTAAMALYIASSLLLVPLVHPVNFILNVPFWSLFFEFWVNAAHAVTLRWLTIRVLLALIILGFAALFAIAWFRGTIDGGLGGLGTIIGGPRVIAGFGLGLLLYRTRTHWFDRLPRLHAIWPMVLLMAALIVPHGTEARSIALVDTVLVATVMPLIVMLGATSRGWGGISAELGLVSYPLYATHFPLVDLARDRLGDRLDQTLPALAVTLVVIAVAAILAHGIDKPVMRYLRRFRPPLAQSQPVAETLP